VHLQTFLSIPVTQKCQILSCYTLVSNEQYVVLARILDEKCLLIHRLKSRRSRAKFCVGIFLEIDSEWKGGEGGSNLTKMVLWQLYENETAVFPCLHVYKGNFYKIHV
jgi:hypothetical protein